MIYASESLFLTQFADDSTITYSSGNLEHTLKIMEEETKKVLEWLAANKLIINLSKTHLMMFTNCRRPESISITVNNQTINEVCETKFLGVIVDNKLCWEAHINHISQKISKSVSILKMLKHTFPSSALKTLYHSLIYPYFNYCNLIWGDAASTHLEQLILLQKKSIRIISKVGYFDHTEQLFKDHKMLTVPKIYDYNCTKFIFLCYNNKSYSYFRSKLQKNSDFHTYETRSRGLLRKPFVRLKKFSNSFLTKGMDIWNILPNEIKTAKSLDSFKIAAKSYMFDHN